MWYEDRRSVLKMAPIEDLRPCLSTARYFLRRQRLGLVGSQTSTSTGATPGKRQFAYVYGNVNDGITLTSSREGLVRRRTVRKIEDSMNVDDFVLGVIVIRFLNSEFIASSDNHLSNHSLVAAIKNNFPHHFFPC